jgi:plasmid stabilization system protein ParE
MTTLRVAEAAECDLQESSAYYEAQHAGLGLELYARFESAVEMLLSYPGLGNAVSKNGFWLGMHGFPYKIIYLHNVDGDCILVVGVLHDRQNPTKWRDRLPS